jgi:hypothetical protein
VVKWRCSEEQAKVAFSVLDDGTWPEQLRLAITAAVGPEVEALRQLAEESTRAHVDEVVSRQNAEQQRDAALARMAALEAEAVAHPGRWTYWRSRSADMTSSWRIQRDRVRRVVAIARRLRAERNKWHGYLDLRRGERDAAEQRAEQAERDAQESACHLARVQAELDDEHLARATAERDLAAMRGERDGARAVAVKYDAVLFAKEPDVGSLCSLCRDRGSSGMGYPECPACGYDAIAIEDAERALVESWRSDAERKGNGNG